MITCTYVLLTEIVIHLCVDLSSFKALITEADERDLPSCPLLEALSLTVTEARKCLAVVRKLFTCKVSTRSVTISILMSFSCGQCWTPTFRSSDKRY